MDDSVDVIVVGAGVIGLATARSLAQGGRSVIVLERAARFGSEISSRNSEVVHAGIYYSPGSLKARLCVAGRQRLYEYCAGHGIPHRRCGKLIVATEPAELEALQALHRTASENGVALERLDGQQALAGEPNLRCVAALWSAASGILDAHAFMTALLGDAEDAGVRLAVRTAFLGASATPSGLAIRTGDDRGTPYEIRCRALVNAGGLSAQANARAIDAMPPEKIPPRHLAKGHYFKFLGRSPFSRLIYPIPEPGGLGVHLTLDLAGQARFGPDVQWLNEIDYGVPAERAARFYPSIRRYFPGLRDGALVPDYAGIRPKIAAASEPNADFVIQGPDDHGVPGLVNLFGIESPGLTAALAIADTVREMLAAT
jgi:L-2-hydroxyglutarate oxidase LhgO